MNIHSDKSILKSNRLAVISLVIGILSLLTYIPFLINIFLFTVVGIRIWILLNVFSGTAFGLIGLITGNIAIGQIENKDIETGHRFAVIGMVLSVLGMIVNIIFCLFIYFFAFYYD